MRPALLCGALALGLAPGCGDAGPEGTAPSPAGATAEPRPWFEEVARASGVEFVHRSGDERRYYFPEIMTGGCALSDLDGDGDLDLYLVQAGDLLRGSELPGNRLYLNDGSGRFEDATEGSGAEDRGYGMGCAAADFDGDGDVDLYVTNVGPNVLLSNRGDGRFEDVTLAAGVGDAGWGSSAAALDYDGDGDLDLWVTNYIDWSIEKEGLCREHGRDYCHPNQYEAPAPDTLYRNEGDGTFTDVSEHAGLRAAYGNGLGVATGDFDGDGRTDVYVANDMLANQLWINQGDGTFRDRGLLAGCALSGSGSAEAGMGAQALDVDDDGDLDLFMTHLRGQTNTLYVNSNGRGVFDDGTNVLGLADASVHFTGFGLGFHDFDHDGALDLFVANGQVMRSDPIHDPERPYAQENSLFAGSKKGRFQEVRPRGGVTGDLAGTSRGAAFGDVDGDGDLDIVVVNQDEGVHLLRNVVGDRGHWIVLSVPGRAGSAAIGARVLVRAGERTWWRRVEPAYSYCSSSDPRVHVGLGAAASVDEVLVVWPDGTERTWRDLAADRAHVLRRPGS